MDKIFEHFTITILRLNKLIQKIKQYEMQSYGLKAIHVMCVYYLSEHPEGLSSTELVRYTLEDKAAISRAVKTLQEDGYVCVTQKVRLTDEGRKLAEFIGERSEKAVTAGSAVLSEEQRVLFYESLSSIANNLAEYYEKLNGDIK